MRTRPVPERRRHVVEAGHRGDEAAARTGLDDDAPSVRAAALGALARCSALTSDDLRDALRDRAQEVRVRAVELSLTDGGPDIVALLDDADDRVVEAAAYALGERGDLGHGAAALASVARRHADELCRESAVAALGAQAQHVETVIAALDDRPTIRRRAVVALAAFEGPEVDAALERALDDRDRQVRALAADLLGLPPV